MKKAKKFTVRQELLSFLKQQGINCIKTVFYCNIATSLFNRCFLYYTFGDDTFPLGT